MAVRHLVGALVIVALSAGPARAASPAATVAATGLPSHALTPGAMNPAVTPATIHRTICVTGWTARVRPPTSVTNALKLRQLRTYGYADRSPSHYEEDHLVPLELGGAPADPRNLWPEPLHLRVHGRDVGAYAKDRLEDLLRARVCSGRQSLRSAQQEIALNWVRYAVVWGTL